MIINQGYVISERMYAESVYTQLNIIQYNTAVYFELEAKIPVMN
jgi:hypothetical protein